MSTHLDTLKEFKGRVDGLLENLDKSDATPQKIGAQRLHPTHLGADFHEAEGLMNTYHQVHGQLEALSKVLSDQIEAMSISVHCAHAGYQNVDAERRDRLWSIYARYAQKPTGQPQPAPTQTKASAATPSNSNNSQTGGAL